MEEKWEEGWKGRVEKYTDEERQEWSYPTSNTMQIIKRHRPYVSSVAELQIYNFKF